jgi:ribonucleoside-diphosphate reductase alpha chain
MANNSAIFTQKPSSIEFLKEWSALADSGTGERGLFNLEAARKQAPERRNAELIRGLNPCAEIMLRSKQFCNLSEVVVRAEDDLDSLLDKVETATWIGVIQSTFTFFPYLRPEWKENCNEERLLGVSLTGQMDNPDLLTVDALKAIKARAIKVAKRAAGVMEINVPAAITCVKPSGTVSQLVDSASGMHPRYSKYYIRRYRISAMDPLFRMIQGQNVPLSPENGQSQEDWTQANQKYAEAVSAGKSQAEAIHSAKNVCSLWSIDGKWSADNVSTWVVSFPVKSPTHCVTRDKMSAIDQLEWYKRVQTSWAEHNCSLTVYCNDDEWLKVGQWVYENWDIVNGVSFLPFDSGRYTQAPYEEINRDEYLKLQKAMPNIDYSELAIYELEDNTQGSQALACSGDKCEIT